MDLLFFLTAPYGVLNPVFISAFHEAQQLPGINGNMRRLDADVV
jgi:hypothetical protein